MTSYKRRVEGEETRPIRFVPTGEFIRKISPSTKRPSKRVYILEGYDRSERKYVATAWDDANFQIYLKSDQLVLVGFTY